MRTEWNLQKILEILIAVNHFILHFPPYSFCLYSIVNSDLALFLNKTVESQI